MQPTVNKLLCQGDTIPVKCKYLLKLKPGLKGLFLSVRNKDTGLAG